MEDPAFYSRNRISILQYLYKEDIIGGFFSGYISTWLCSTTHFPLFMILCFYFTLTYFHHLKTGDDRGIRTQNGCSGMFSFRFGCTSAL